MLKKKVTELAIVQRNGEMLQYVDMKRFKETKKQFSFIVQGCEIVINKANLTGWSIKRG